VSRLGHAVRLRTFSWCGRGGSVVPFVNTVRARRTARRWASLEGLQIVVERQRESLSRRPSVGT